MRLGGFRGRFEHRFVGHALEIWGLEFSFFGWSKGMRLGGCRNVLWFRGGLVFKAHRLCVPLNSRLESNKEEKKRVHGLRFGRDISVYEHFKIRVP